jgi:membrane-associated phospholipid phosphatase
MKRPGWPTEPPIVFGLTSIFMVAFVLLYGGSSVLAEAIPWRFVVTLPGEDAIALVPEASWVYLSLDALLLLAPFMLRRPRDIYPLFIALCVELVVGVLCFLAFPVVSTFPEQSITGASGAVFAIADALNFSNNYLPSLHVAFAWTAAAAMAKEVSWPTGLALRGWAASIAVSTVLIHEHHIADVVAGVALAEVCWRWSASRSADWLDVDCLCADNMLRFGWRHPRYFVVGLLVVQASLPRWRKSRLLRTGYSFLQAVDDLLDGDRPCDGEPLDVVDGLVAEIHARCWSEAPLSRLGRAFTGDLLAAGGESALKEALALVDTMRADRRRVLDVAIWTEEQLQEHHYATFSRSFDLLFLALGSKVRCDDVPELVRVCGWCSTMRDLADDLDQGLINVPDEVMREAAGGGVDAIVGSAAGKVWVEKGRGRALADLDALDLRLASLPADRGTGVVRTFAKSVRDFAVRRLPAIYGLG